ncbi:helix-turn-helix transcriptional regulator [Streptomyces roseoverticillatus]|uniref:helix-turn-helix domain-containing protein n=1 Tax=Streptomyces roseoverticillatus TaxID=66429 RepID=UPI001F461865|nr:helix-turn-helix transcriptional regulator [Streptomyces roseoverticillatus]MCF3105570.1 helix-turn-helix transcriptional regulator [Streptomyces roseoverticillatus]
MGVLSDPPMAWRLCGNQLQLWRQAANVSREALAAEAGYGVEAVRSMEMGRRRPSQHLLEVADTMFGACGKLKAAHPYLEPERFVSRAREYMALEAEAIAFHWYELSLIPGLLQTEDYARALLTSRYPPVDEEVVEERVVTRLERQAVLQKATTVFSFVIHELALRTPVGGPEAMKAQLLHLLEVGKARNVSLQVMPIGSTVGIDGSFIVLETPENRLYGYQEAQMASMLHAEAEMVSVLMKRHALIRTHALSPDESVQFIQKMVEEL